MPKRVITIRPAVRHRDMGILPCLYFPHPGAPGRGGFAVHHKNPPRYSTGLFRGSQFRAICTQSEDPTGVSGCSGEVVAYQMVPKYPLDRYRWTLQPYLSQSPSRERILSEVRMIR